RLRRRDSDCGGGGSRGGRIRTRSL
ncbi:hypothetical protein TorRG33x02_249680, partial [Trema orientale]